METIIDHLTRFKTEDLMEELTIKGVLNSRILKIFKNSLGEGLYYCICYRNLAFKKLEILKLKRNNIVWERKNLKIKVQKKNH